MAVLPWAKEVNFSEGLDEDSLLQPWAFDLVTKESSEKLPLDDYLRDTGRDGPAFPPESGRVPSEPATQADPEPHAHPLPAHFLPTTPAIMEVSVRQAANAVNRHLEEGLWNWNSPASP